MLERHVDIGEHIAAVHQRNRLVDMRIRVDILQSHPGAERAQFARDVEKARGDLAVPPRALGVFKVEAVGARILRDDDQLLTPAFTSRSASRRTSPAGREASRPRKLGMMQNVQRWSQPSEILR